MKYLLLSFLLLLNLDAAILLTPFEAIHNAYGKDVTVSKRNILITSDQASAITKIAKQKLSTKIYRTFKVEKGSKIIAYGVLTVNKMRTKDAVVLFLINLKGSIESVHTVAFNEPPEFVPNDTWNTLFVNKDKSNTLRVGKDIPTITGATLSARGYADGARLALAVYDVVLKAK